MKNIEELEKESVLHLSSWWGLSPTPGAKHIFITNDKYYECSKYFQNKEKEYFIEKDLNDTAKNKIITYIKENLLTRENEYFLVFDAGWAIDVFLDNKKVSIVNNLDLYNQVLSEITKILEGEN